MIPEQVTMAVLREVAYERTQQDRKWGEQNHAPTMWMVILAEEVGEAAEQSLKAHFTANAGAIPLSNYRAEMVQVAAVAVAAIESLDRALSQAEAPDA